jgi:hypothetical protein
MPRKAELPHSWPLASWEPSVYPNNQAAAVYMFRAHKDSLIKAGAIVRVGRGLVVIGYRYARWLELQAKNVPDYEIAANRNKKPR